MNDNNRLSLEKIAEPEKKKSALEELFGGYKTPLYEISSLGHMYQGSYHFMRIDTCHDCKFCAAALEDGGDIENQQDEDESHIWYFCRKGRYKNWPRRIGQIADIKKEVAFFCQLEYIIPESAKMRWEAGDPPITDIDMDIVQDKSQLIQEAQNIPPEDKEAQNLPQPRLGSLTRALHNRSL